MKQSKTKVKNWVIQKLFSTFPHVFFATTKMLKAISFSIRKHMLLN